MTLFYWWDEMKLLREEKDYLDKKGILSWLDKYETDDKYIPRFKKLERYSSGDNPTIMDKDKKEVNNPDNRVPISYGRKLITTFKGYGYRPGYITYEVDEDKDKSYLETMTEIFEMNHEHLKTSTGGENTGIYGQSYELLYINEESEIRFVPIPPQEMILLYDYEAEPNIKIAIRSVKINDNKYTIYVYYPDKIEEWEKTRKGAGTEGYEWELTKKGNGYDNPFTEIPIVPYYLDNNREGIIWPVHYLIDMLDALISGNMDEFERFANSYLRLVGMSLDSPSRLKSENAIRGILRRIKKLRAFEQLQHPDDVTFLTKDLPTEFLKMMYDILIEQIHKQSHVTDMDQRELSGVAVQRMMYDFENVISTAEAEFDKGLYRRMELINVILKVKGIEIQEPSVIKISHKRNAPLNLKEFAESARTMKEAGLSMHAILRNMPDDMIPDIDNELAYQEEERNALMPDLYGEGNEIRSTGGGQTSEAGKEIPEGNPSST